MAEENRAAPADTKPAGEERIVRSATEARQGKIVLGRYGQVIWIASFVVIVILALVFWSL